MQNKMITLYENSNQYVNAAVDKIVVEIFNKRKPDSKKAQTVLMLGASPLVGTTSTAIDLAIATASTGRKVLLIDCDVRKAEKYKKLNQQVESGLADYLLQSGDIETIHPEDILYDTNVAHLQYVPCGSYTANPTRVMCSPKLAPLMVHMQENFDYIICDLPSITLVPDGQILFPLSDGIILVTALGETSKKSIKEAKKKIAPFADKYYGMIINKISSDIYRKNVKDYDYYLPDMTGNQKLGGSPARREYEKRRKEEEKVR